jgi:glycosyl-4,4'-diaponeurosporenoate acyltransferase
MYPGGLASLVEGWTKNMAMGASLSKLRSILLLVIWFTGISNVSLAAGGAWWSIAAVVAVYGLYTAQVWVQLRRVGSFSLLSALLFPLEFLFFVAVFVYSIIRTRLFGSVSWKGRGMMGNELLWIIVLNSLAWFLVIFIPGAVIQKLPLRLFREDGFLYRTGPWERGGRVYVALGIKRWKELLPDGAGIFPDGFRKKRVSIHGVDELYLKRFILETCRAELVHWLIIALIPLFFIWNPPQVAVWMIPFGLAINLPCLQKIL